MTRPADPAAHAADPTNASVAVWPRWLRLAGMDIGPKCEISTIIDVVPELVTIGAETFFADGIYLGAGHVVRGTVTLGHTRLGRNNFLGNHAVVPQGEVLPDNVLFGISTLAEGAKVPGGGARFGHPSFALPRREVVEAASRETAPPAQPAQAPAAEEAPAGTPEPAAAEAAPGASEAPAAKPAPKARRSKIREAIGALSGDERRLADRISAMVEAANCT